MRYVARRLGLFVLTLWAALTVNFLIPRLMPGNAPSPVLSRMKGVSPAALHALRPSSASTPTRTLVAYVTYLGNCLTLKFGLDAARSRS